MKAVAFFLCALLSSRAISQEIFGFWKTVDASKGFTTSILAVYAYQNRAYGQLIVTYDDKSGILIDTLYTPVQTVQTIKGKPFLVKICLFWNLEKKGTKYIGGTVLDPRSGMKFGCELWTNDGLLVIRGLIGPFGMNEVFYPACEQDFPLGFKKPELLSFIPVLP